MLLVEYGGVSSAVRRRRRDFAPRRRCGARRGRVDLLKVGHHGSRGSSGDEWLDSLRPRAAVISVGAGTATAILRRKCWRG